MFGPTCSSGSGSVGMSAVALTKPPPPVAGMDLTEPPVAGTASRSGALARPPVAGVVSAALAESTGAQAGVVSAALAESDREACAAPAAPALV